MSSPAQSLRPAAPPGAPRRTTRGEAPATAGGRKTKRQVHLVFLLPAAVFLALFSLYPLVQLTRMSVSAVSTANLNGAWPFVGLENFTETFTEGGADAALWRTLVFVAVVTAVGIVGGLAAAIALRTSGRWSAAVLAVMVFVWALPPVVNGSVWKFLLNDDGLVNALLLGTGLREDPAPFLYDGTWALLSVGLVNSLAVVPFNALVFRAALLGIDPQVFEAAALDGASKWQEIRHVMLPTVRPTTLVLLVLTIVYGFRSFDFIYVMTYGGPGTATNTLPFLGYLQAFARYDFGLGAATSGVAVLGVLVLAAVYARSIRREEADT
jgi:multiple sugar transport system permease protein